MSYILAIAIEGILDKDAPNYVLRFGRRIVALFYDETKHGILVGYKKG